MTWQERDLVRAQGLKRAPGLERAQGLEQGAWLEVLYDKYKVLWRDGAEWKAETR